MARGCSWCTLVALIVLLFVTTEGLRDRATQTDDQKIANRGNLRFNSKSVEEATSTTTIRSRSFRDRTTQPTLSKYDDGTTLTSITEPESKFDSIKRSFAPITTTDATNYLRRTPSGRNGETKKTEPTVNRRNGRRYSTDNNEETKSRDNNQKVESSNRLSRKTSNGREGGTNVTEKLENGGPSVFQATTESSRSRTGRKIQTTYSVKDIKTQVPASRRFGNRKNAEETATVSIRREGRGRSTTEKVERSTRASRSKANLRENNSVNRRSQDVPLIESESIRVDIPLSVDETDSPVSDVTTPFGIVSQRRSDTKEPTRNNNRTGSERSKNRSRLNDFDTASSSKSNSRRGSSKFNDQTSTEANEQVISPRRNVVARDRKRGPESKKNSPNEPRLRSNARNLENSVKSSADGSERDVKRKSSANRRSRVVDGTPKAVANRGQDSQDSRSKLRNRSRSDATTTITPDVTTTVAQETTAFGDVTTVNSEFTSTTLRSTTLSPPSSRTTTRSPVAAITPSSTTISTSEVPGRSRGRNRGGGQRKKQKEDFFNHGLGFRGRKPTPETPLANTVDPQRNTLRNDSQPFGSPGWTLRRRPSHTYNSESPTRAVLSPPRDQTNEVIPSNEISTSTETVTTEENLISSTNRGYKKLQTTEETATVEATTKGYRRGGKSFGFGKVTVEPSENDNYPPEFKARLKSTNTKIPALVTTPRSPSEVKKSSAALFSERSRMKLELARRLVKPELNIEENDLDATTASSFNEPISTVISITDETSKILKYSKSSSPSMGRRVYTPVESSPEQVNGKDSKVSNSRKGQGNISKVRSSGSKKGRIIAERMVTSISVEERAVSEETTKPYSLPTNPPTIVSTSTEEGSATSVDTTKVRLPVNRGGNKSKEDDATVKKDVNVSMAVPRRVSDNDSTLTSRKPYVYQSRGKGLQQSGSVEQESTESLMKKSHVSSQTKFNAGQRRFQGSQEDDASEKPRFSTSTSRSTLRPRYSKRIKQKSSNEMVNSSENTVPTKSRVAVGRYSRKKSVVKSLDEKNKSITEDPEKQTKRHEFRPRTATYRRHSEVPLTLVQSSPRIEGVGVAITPKTPRYHATLKTSTVSPRSVSQEAQVNLRIANESTSDSPGVIGSSDGDSGNANIFNPARSAILSANGTLIEQLRSTVAPLLSSLGNKTPVFSGSYSNVNNANSPPRITPSGQPPRFSARYKGAELFVRKQNNVYQPTVPSITSSSTTPSTPVENSGSSPPIDVSSPGEPKFLTFYHTLESVNVKNERLQGNTSAQSQVVDTLQVDANATVSVGDNFKNDTVSPTVETTSPQIPDTIANTTRDSTQTPRLNEDTESSTPAVTTGAPEFLSTIQPVSTSVESSSNMEQASTTESFSTTEQTSSSSSTEQIPTSTILSIVTEQTGTESSTQIVEMTTMNPGAVNDVQSSQVADVDFRNLNLSMDVTVLTNSTTGGISIESSTVNNEIRSTEAVTVFTGQQNVTQTTIGSTIVSEVPTIATTEDVETNTIPFSETTVAQTVDSSSTGAPTTEEISNNMIDMETTTMIPSTTVRGRLIDFAQDILSRLQASLSSTTVPNQDLTTTMSSEIEMSNAIPDSKSNNLETLSQLRDESTSAEGDSGTTTLSPIVMSTLTAVGSVTTQLPSMVSVQEADTQDDLNLITTTTPPTTTTTIVTQEPQTISNTESELLDDLNSSTNTLLDNDTTSTTPSNDDTLLTELMSIAKTLLSEAMNDTEQITQSENVTSRAEKLLENNVDRPGLSNDVLGMIQGAESSSISPDVTTESVESASTTVSEFSTFSVDPSQNEIDSTNLLTTVPSESSRESSTVQTPQNNVSSEETTSVRQTTDDTTLALDSFTDNVPTTPSTMKVTESQVTLPDRTSLNIDTSTESQSTTQSSETTTAINVESTANTINFFSPDTITPTEFRTASEPITENVVESVTNVTTASSQLETDTGTDQVEVTTVIPETTPSLVNRVALDSFDSTVMSITELVQSPNVVDTETNLTMESTTKLPPMTTQTTIVNDTPEVIVQAITTTLPLDVNDMVASTNQSSLISTTEPLDVVTNIPNESTNLPQTTPNLENDTPTTIVARFQDTTSTTAQGTAGSGIGQTTEPSSSMIPETSTTVSPRSSTSTGSESPLTTTTSPSVVTMTTTMTTETTPTAIGRVPDAGTTTISSRMDVATVTPMTEAPTTISDVATEENRTSTEAGATMASPENITTTTMDTRQGITNETATTSTPSMTMPTSTTPTTISSTQAPTSPQLGRFGGNRLTPAPRFSVSSSTRAPLRDYLVYGIYPNKTIVRKRPEDNLIDARNVDSPYVIFGIFPDGRLVRKFPNGTIIPDPPRNPVEVVFSLSTTTTTNRPLPRPYYNPANQGTYNLYRGPVYDNNDRPVPMRNVQTPGTVDLRLTGNAIVGPNGGGPDNTGPLGTPASVPSTNETNDALRNTQTGPVPSIVSTGRPPTDSQGGRIVQDRERDEATRTKEAGGQRSSVYIGQEKFVNYWTDQASTTSPRVHSVNINTVASAASVGRSPAIPSFENLLDNQPSGQVTAPPGFPWRDPLDQIFGITTPSPVITASVASNTLDDTSDGNVQGLVRPMNPFVEVFTPFSSAIGVPRGNVGTVPPPPMTTAGTSSSATTTTTTAPTTTTITPITTTTTTSTTMLPTTTTTTTTTTPSTTPQQSSDAASQTVTNSNAASPITSVNLQQNLLNAQAQNPFGSTFNDLAFLNSLLQDNTRSSTQKTLTQIEQLLANKILSLAINNPGPTRSPKAINPENASPNSIFHSSTRSPFEPIVIDLNPSSTATAPTWKPAETPKTTTPKSTISTAERVTWKPVTTAKKDIEFSTGTTVRSTTKIPATVKPKPATTPRPRTTTQAPLGLGSLLWQALLGGNIFGPSTTAKPVKTKPVKTAPKSVNITPKPIPATQKPDTATILRDVDVSKIRVSTANSILIGDKSGTTPASISSTKQPLLNNPNPRLPNVATSTFSPEEDTKFLLELLRAAEKDNKGGGASKKVPGLTQDDESFLRAILSGRALTTTTTTTQAPTSDIDNAALLAALLKARGIEPKTPASNLREQLLLASLGQSVTSAPTAFLATESTTIATRPASAATRPTDTKQTVTPSPTSGPRTRTTTWSPSSTYPPSFLSSFSNYGTPVLSAAGDNSGNNALFGVTRAFGQFLGTALSGAAQQLQSFVRNGSRIVSEAVG